MATKLQDIWRSVARGGRNILGFGRVKVKNSERGSAKKSGASFRSKSALTMEQDVSREPHCSDQSLAMMDAFSLDISSLLLSVLSLD